MTRRHNPSRCEGPPPRPGSFLRPPASGLKPAVVSLFLLCSLSLAAGQPPPKEEPFPILESELTRVSAQRMGLLPWEAEGHAAAPAAPPAAALPEATPGMIDVSSTDVTIAASGPFSRVTSLPVAPGAKPQKAAPGAAAKETKEILSLEDQVEILQPGTGTILRGKHFQVQRDLEAGNMDWLYATGQVEMVMGERKARGETLVYQTRYGPVQQTTAGPRQELLLNEVTIEGDHATRKPATMWAGDDAIQALKFVLDMRGDTYRALGGALVDVRLPPAPGASPAAAGPRAPAAKAAPANPMFPGLALTPGARVVLSCDGDLNHESFSGRVHLRRNVCVQQEGFRMWADEMDMQLEPAAAQTPGPQTGVFSGTLRSLDCRGRIEIVTTTQVVHCDQVHYDLKLELLQLSMNKIEDKVRIYFRDPAWPQELRATQVLHAKHHIVVDTRTQAITDRTDLPPAPMGIDSFNKPIPRPRPSGAVAPQSR